MARLEGLELGAKCLTPIAKVCKNEHMPQISDREFHVLVGLSNGLDAKEIGARMQLSRRSVDYVIESLKVKAGDRSMTLRGLIVRTAQDGILEELLGWRLSATGQLVRSVQAATRRSLGLSLPPQ